MTRESPRKSDADGSVMSSTLAAKLKQKILSGEFEVGSSLPAERDLIVHYEVSRATLREALRALGAQGLLEVRRGRRGGSYVCAPSSDRVSDTLNMFIAGHNIKFVDLLAVREAIEPVAAAQAAQFRSDEDIKTIRRILAESEQALSDLEKFSALNIEWHTAVVEASKNPLFLSIMTSISPALYSATTREEFDLTVRETVLRTHTRISDAIEAGDGDAARRRMSRHVSSYGAQLDFSQESRELRTAE